VTGELVGACTGSVTDMVAGNFGCHLTISTAIVARRDATEQRSYTVVLCDAASRVRMSARARASK
jgi:hypothetical protein